MIKMAKEETRILDYLSDKLGGSDSILGITKEISKIYGNAYYSNIYNAIAKLQKSSIITLHQEGKNRSIKLNLKNPLSIYYLSETEDRKTGSLGLSEYTANAFFDLALDSGIITMCLLNYKEYAKINRIELLIITASNYTELLTRLLKIESMRGTKIDPIILTPNELSEMLGSEDINRIKDLIIRKNIIYNSEGFWSLIRRYKINDRISGDTGFPTKIERAEIAYNYNRFGYGLYEDTKQGKTLSIEDTILLMSESTEIRIRYGAIILLKKNIEKIKMPYVYYLFKRYDELGTLKGMLFLLRRICDRAYTHKIDALLKQIPNKQFKIFNKEMINRYLTE